MKGKCFLPITFLLGIKKTAYEFVLPVWRGKGR
jgi:hypothetical protein